jgi:ABC-type transport system involved in multi-copper enzyme maturation permease subunit
MIKVLRTEWLKIKNYWAFWGVMIMTSLAYPGINYMFWYEYHNIVKKESATGKIAKMLLGNPFVFPETFHTTAFFSSIFVFIPAIVVIMLITNEYTYKTNRQNIIDGWSRQQFLAGKFMNVLLITLLVTLLYAIIAFVIGFVASPQPLVKDAFSEVKYIGLFALQSFSQLSIAFFIGFLIRRSFIALSVFVFYFIILENFAVAILKVKANDIGKYLPLEISDRLIPIPRFIGRLDEKQYAQWLSEINTHVWYTIILTAAIWGLCYYINKKRDL